jgi:apolipoprotein N-acyltransferase
MAITVASIRDGWRGIVLSALVGCLLPFAFAPVNIIPLAIISPGILFWLWLCATPGRSFILGYWFGLGFFGVGVSWVAISFYRFGGMGITLSTLATLLFVLFLALFPAILGWLGRRYLNRLPDAWWLLLFLPAAWVFFEWVRGWIFTGFPWLNLGYSQTDSPLSGLAPVLGVYGISWVVAFTAGVLVWVVQQKGRIRIITVVGVFLLWLTAGLLTTVEWTSERGKPLTTSLIQGNIPQNLKWRPEQRRATIDLYTRLSREHWNSDLIIWPETALPVFYHQAKSYLQGLAQEAKTHGGAAFLIGLPVADSEDTAKYYNGVVVVGGEEEKTPQFYFKTHLVPFGEYVPLKSLLGGLLDILKVPMADFSRGKENQQPLSVDGQQVGVFICYEDAFGEEVIRDLPEASLLVNVSNDAWFGDSLAPHQHLQMGRMRAMETARPLLSATNNGISALIDYDGRVIKTAPQFKVSVLNGEIQPRQGATPYVLMGNWPVISGICLALLVSGLRVRRSTLNSNH